MVTGTIVVWLALQQITVTVVRDNFRTLPDCNAWLGEAVFNVEASGLQPVVKIAECVDPQVGNPSAPSTNRRRARRRYR